LNITKDKNLKGVPFLILFDKNNKLMDQEDSSKSLSEELRNKLNTSDVNYNIQQINFEYGKEEIYYGLDWLCDQMKPLG
jgi:hypothetical protein